MLLSSSRAVGAFHPPQSYRYLRGDDLWQVTEAAPETGTALRKVLGELVSA